MKKSVFLISGGTNGIGFHTAQEIAKGNRTIIIIGKNLSKGENKLKVIKNNSGNKDVHYINGDLSSQKEIKKMVTIIQKKFTHIDVLINNVGIFSSKRKESEDDIEKTFATNHLSYFLLTGLLLPMLLKSQKPRIINVASSIHRTAYLNFDDIEMKKKYNGVEAYRQSKLCNILFTYFLSDKLNLKNITVNCLHPGSVNTGLGDNNKNIIIKILIKSIKKIFKKKSFFFNKKNSQSSRLSGIEGAKTSIYLATNNNLEKITGKYYHGNEALNSSEQTYDKNLQKKLWILSEKYTNFSY